MTFHRICSGLRCLVLSTLITLICSLPCPAQQTLGSLNGTVVDASGAAVSQATVTAVNEQTGLTQSSKTINSGYWQILDLPIGNYKVTVTHEGFGTVTFPALLVQEGRATTINATLKVGKVSESVTVNANPMLNATDTTNGYTLDKAQIAETPLATGSFTQLAILAPGVTSQFIAGVGTNQGLGNQNIWANGQRATSNTMTVNGVNVTNLFNGNTASEQTSQRYQFDIGEGATTGGQTQDNVAVYGSNGNGLASLRRSSCRRLALLPRCMTRAGPNQRRAHRPHHQQRYQCPARPRYGMRGTNFMNADPFFYKQDVALGTILPQYVNPQLHKWVAGGTLGGRS